MFSNGAEHDAFMELNCFRCRHYVPFEEASPERPMCAIEDRITLAMVDENAFPYDWLDENGLKARYTCRRRIGRGRKGVDEKVEKWTVTGVPPTNRILWKTKDYFAEWDGEAVNIVDARKKALIQQVEMEAYNAIVRGLLHEMEKEKESEE